MSELQNPLFDEEKEFLERKKLEYERALRGDVDHIKEQSATIGKVALVGAGLAGGVWLISKAFGGKKKKRKSRPDRLEVSYDKKSALQLQSGDEDEDDGEYFTSGNGKRYKSKQSGFKSAADSAKVFAAQDEHGPEADDLGFGSTAALPFAESGTSFNATAEANDFDDEVFEEDPFQDLPYDDSRRLPTSHAFDVKATAPAKASASRSHVLGSVLQAFLKSDTGKVIVAQAAAIAMAMVTKKVNEFFPATKNSDLATSPDAATSVAPGYPVASSASPVSSDASQSPQSS